MSQQEKKMVIDYVNILQKRENMTPEMIKKEVFETFGIEFDLEVVQERKKAKELTMEDISLAGGMIDMK